MTKNSPGQYVKRATSLPGCTRSSNACRQKKGRAMRDIARRSVKDRSELFRATSQVMHVHEAIVEKDFWVCWILDYLFQDSPWKDRLIFKGGTSLSKAFGAI